MAEKILVPLKRHDRVEEMIPYIEKVTQPGVSVLFLVHHRAKSRKWLEPYCGIMECGPEKTIAIRKMIESYSEETRRQLAEQRVFHTCAALHRLKVKVAVEMYTGSLRKALRNYMRGGEVGLIVMQPRVGDLIMNFLQGMVSISNVIGRTAFSPVFILSPKGHAQW